MKDEDKTKEQLTANESMAVRSELTFKLSIEYQ
jgi:hypothetical protein